jgi:signal transduction histidine kinase
MAARLRRKGRNQETNPRQHLMPILAINARGEIKRANTPARKILDADLERMSKEDGEVGMLLAEALARRRGDRRRTLLSFLDGEAREDILLVLSADSPQAQASAGVALQEEPAPEQEGDRGRFIDFIAHELRNPLGAIAGLSQILRNRFSTIEPEDRGAALETMQSEAEKALLILDGFLRLAETRTRARPETANVPLHAVLRKVVSAHIRRNPHRSISVQGDTPLFARANSLWVELALSNLLSNAEKYTPKDRAIELAFQQSGSTATILVLDSGVSMRQETYNTLWGIYGHGPDPGVRVSGSGIGLALCKELIEGMGGRVWAGPREPQGSVFAFSLPGPWDKEVPAPLATPLSEHASGPNLRLAGSTAWS